jgi:hypothetical protein
VYQSHVDLFRLLVGLLISLLAGCASVPSGPRTRLVLGDREIRAGNGTFVFREVVLDGNTLPGSWNIMGIIRNNTGRDWKRIVFDFELYDMTGSSLRSQIDSKITSMADSLTDGGVLPFGTNYFKALNRPDALQLIWKYEVTYEGAGSGKQIFVMTKPWDSRELLFEDQAIRIRFSLSEKQIGMILQNKLQLPIKVDWNNISYVDITGLAHGVMHTGVRYMERDRPQVPTIIPPAAMIDDVIVPSDHISYTPGSGSGWSSRSLFPGIITETDQYIGKSFSVFIPLEFDGAVKNYLFSFRIEREAT